MTALGSTVRDNVASLRFMLEEATYLQGMLAALLSKTGKAGAVGGMAIPPVKSTIMAFRAGARAVRSDFEVLTSYVGNWEDVGAAREATLALVHQGADVLFQNADAAGIGVLQVAEEEGILAFGSNKNQNNVAPNAVLASAVIDIPDAFLTVAEKVQEGRFTPRVERLGMKEGIITLEFNPQLMERVPPDVLARIDTAREQIVAGSLVVPAAEF